MDRNAFRDFIHRHEWTFAKTYAAFCPHEYLVMNRQPKEEWPLFPEIAKLIREEGFTAEYGKLGPNRYYIVDDYYEGSGYQTDRTFLMYLQNCLREHCCQQLFDTSWQAFANNGCNWMIDEKSKTHWR